MTVIEGIIYPVAAAIIFAVLVWVWKRCSGRVNVARILISNHYDAVFSVDFTLINASNHTVLIDEFRIEKLHSEPIYYKSKAASAITIDLEEDAYIAGTEDTLKLPRHQKILPGDTERETVHLRTRGGDWFGVYELSVRSKGKLVADLGSAVIFFLGRNTSVNFNEVSEEGYQKLSASPLMTEQCAKFYSTLFDSRVLSGKSNR